MGNVRKDDGDSDQSGKWDNTADTSASMIEAALSGSEQRLHEAYVKFCQRYFATVRRWCSRHFPESPDSADEAASELMLNIYEKLRKYKPQKGKSFRSWLSVVTRNECFDLRRKAKQRQQRVTEIDGDADVAAKEDNLIFELLVDSERRNLIQDLLAKASDRIPERDRAILEGYLAERSPQEIADLNATTLGAVYTAMSRIRVRLADIITQLLREHPGVEIEDLMNPA